MGAELVAFLFSNYLQTVHLGFGDRVDFNGVDDGG